MFKELRVFLGGLEIVGFYAHAFKVSGWAAICTIAQTPN